MKEKVLFIKYNKLLIHCRISLLLDLEPFMKAARRFLSVELRATSLLPDHFEASVCRVGGNEGWLE